MIPSAEILKRARQILPGNSVDIFHFPDGAGLTAGSSDGALEVMEDALTQMRGRA